MTGVWEVARTRSRESSRRSTNRLRSSLDRAGPIRVHACAMAGLSMTQSGRNSSRALSETYARGYTALDDSLPPYPTLQAGLAAGHAFA